MTLSPLPLSSIAPAPILARCGACRRWSRQTATIGLCETFDLTMRADAVACAAQEAFGGRAAEGRRMTLFSKTLRARAGKTCGDCAWFLFASDRSIGTCRRFGAIEISRVGACDEWGPRCEPKGE